jgi:hypothetical protein
VTFFLSFMEKNRIIVTNKAGEGTPSDIIAVVL